MSHGKELFESVIVISLKDNLGVPEPYISYQFPPKISETGESVANTMTSFCFPEAELWLKDSFKQKFAKKHESFSVTLTDVSGARKFGYCRRFVVKDSKEGLIPECFCILTTVPSASLFVKILDIIQQLRDVGSSRVFAFLKAVLAQSFPEPGQTVHVKTFEGGNYAITRAADDFLLDFVTFEDLISKISVDKLMDIFAAVVSESRVCLISTKHIYIPILPKSLMSYVCAPIPFLIGVLTTNLTELNKMPLEEMVMLDIDSGKFMRDLPENADWKKILPEGPAQTLRKALVQATKYKKVPEQLNLELSLAFLQFHFEIFQGYQKYCTGKFDFEGFKTSRNPAYHKYIDVLQETQLFNIFTNERCEMVKNNTIKNCVLHPEKNEQLVRKTMSLQTKTKDITFCINCQKKIDLSYKAESVEIHDQYLCIACHALYQTNPSSFKFLIEDPKKKEPNLKKKEEKERKEREKKEREREKKEKKEREKEERERKEKEKKEKKEKEGKEKREQKEREKKEKEEQKERERREKEERKEREKRDKISPRADRRTSTLPSSHQSEPPNPSPPVATPSVLSHTIASQTEPTTLSSRATVASAKPLVDCKGCSKKISTDTAFCIFCGAKVGAEPVTCPNCKFVNRLGGKFCSECASPISWRDTRSGTQTTTSAPQLNLSRDTHSLRTTKEKTSFISTSPPLPKKGSSMILPSLDRANSASPAIPSKAVSKDDLTKTPVLSILKPTTPVLSILKPTTPPTPALKSKEPPPLPKTASPAVPPSHRGSLPAPPTKAPPRLEFERKSAKIDLSVCQGCLKPYGATVIEAFGGIKFHPECFRCEICKNEMTTQYISKNGKFYHSDCFKATLERCPVCSKALVGRISEADNGKKVHTACFVCNQCGTPIATGYCFKNDKYFCGNCGK